jgi:hypothetical protein
MSFEKEIVKVINKDQQEVEQKKDFAIERDKEKDSSKVINIDNLEVQEKSLYVENNNNNFEKMWMFKMKMLILRFKRKVYM